VSHEIPQHIIDEANRIGREMERKILIERYGLERAEEILVSRELGDLEYDMNVEEAP
jgi:hypothetical protein